MPLCRGCNVRLTGRCCLRERGWGTVRVADGDAGAGANGFDDCPGVGELNSAISDPGLLPGVHRAGCRPTHGAGRYASGRSGSGVNGSDHATATTADSPGP